MMKTFTLIKPYFIERRFPIFMGLVSLIVVDFLQLFIPRIIKWVVDDLTAYRIDSHGLLKYTGYIICIGLMIGILRYVWRRCLLGTSRRVEEGLRNKLFYHIQTLSASYFNKTKTGDLMAHATNDIQQIRMATGMGMVAFNDAIVLGAAAIGFMLYINVKLTLFVMIPMPCIVFGTRFFSKKMHHQYQRVQETFSDLTEAVRERFSGIRVIKSYNREQSESEKLEALSENYMRSNLQLIKITGSFFPLMLFFSNLSLAVVLYLGGRQTILSTITPGDFVAFISYLGLLTWPMMAMGWVVNLIQRGRASLDRLDKIFQTTPELRDLPSAVSFSTMKTGIEFEKVSFSYQKDPQDNPKTVISDISFRVGRGSALGIVGPPGSGKTTLLSLIPRMFDVTDGRILIDGIDLRKVKIRDLRSQIAFMPQEPFLFAGSIRQNITFDEPSFNEKDLILTVKKAAFYPSIQSMPKGFDTVIGEKGVILSGGQKQRLALSRALLKSSPVLIFDDPISQVDMATGDEIIKTIRSMIGLSTVIIVSHRLSALSFADQIMVLDNGKIVEFGTHKELMGNNQYYARTFKLQEIEEEYKD